MKPHTAIAAPAALLFGLLLLAMPASAALFSSSHAKPSDSLTLPSAQQKTAWSDLKSKPNSNAPSSFQPSTSSALPSTVTVHAVPAKTATDVPAQRPYDYVKADGKLLIVNPRDMMIAEVIGG
ncbi:MAG TPA: hypothetical protein VL048_12090 [Xanthobacteraceae bacterium]|nr:hypothetical protein [Xanthobacteraceae bacterium]